MALNSEPARLLREERLADRRRAMISARDARRSTGVAWSGLAPDPFRPRSDAALARDAANRLAALQQWRASPVGRLQAAMAQAERAVLAIRASVARSGDLRHIGSSVIDLTLAAQAAMDVQALAVLTDGACATNSDSSSPSTISPRPSAS